MFDVHWNLDQDKKEELIYRARLRYNSWEEMADDVSMSAYSLRAHRNGDRDSISLEHAGSLLNKVETDSALRNHDAIDFAEDDEPRELYGDERVELLEGASENIFRSFPPDMAKELFGLDSDSLNRFRNGSYTFAAFDDFKQAFEVLDTFLDQDYAVAADLEISGERSVIVEEASPEDVRELSSLRRGIENIRENDPVRFGYFKSSSHVFDELANSGEEYISGDGNSEGKVFDSLEDMGLLEYWSNTGGSTTYKVDAPREYFDIVGRKVQHYIEDEDTGDQGYTDEELIGILQEHAEGDEPREQRFFDKNESLPAAKTYQNHFGSWNNAVWRAGLETVETRVTDDEMFSYILEKYREDESRPSRQEVLSDPDAPSRTAIENRFGTFDSFLDEAGIPDLNEDYDPGRYQAFNPAYQEKVLQVSDDPMKLLRSD